jgi:predicted Zn-ribbon and HTH transcriptional regulator
MDLVEKYLGERTTQSTPMKCMECGHKFKKKLGRNTTEVKCPKCKGYDTDVA